MVTIIMCIVTMIIMVLVGSSSVGGLLAIYTPLLILVVCLGYCPLDFSGKIMLGEVGNHTFGVALGVAFYLVGGFWWLLLLFLITTALIAFVRRNTLKVFFRQRLGLVNPTFGDYFMDVLTGGGLGDLIRKLVFKEKQYPVTSPLLVSLGFRRLLYNPYARRSPSYPNDDIKPRINLRR